MKRIYYRIVYTLDSPLSVGSGQDDNTDMDVMLNSIGEPYIPATSIAGVLRHGLNDTDKENTLFGSLDSVAQSPVIVYDAELDSEDTISVRDSVELDENKCGVDGAKFDFEIVETGAKFIGYIELTDKAVTSYNEIEHLLARVNSGELRFGRKTTRGCGKVMLSVKKIVFDDIEKWLDFDMFAEHDWDNADIIVFAESTSEMTHIKLSLKMIGGISIREYTTELPKNIGGDTAPDYKSLTLHGSGVPVIPGTSWAGAFRSRFTEFMGKEATEYLFGYIIPKTQETQKSKIQFGESIIEGATPKLITRNSIDRFSAGTNDGALYTELTYFGGDTVLEITIPADVEKSYKNALAAVIADLHNGFLAVGGLTAIGRGLFQVTEFKINGSSRINEFKSFAEEGGVADAIYQ